MGFLIALAAAAVTAWLFSRNTVGFEFRTVGASPSAARSAGINVERVWVLAFLIAGGLAGLSAATIVQGQTALLTSSSYGTYGFDGITVALLAGPAVRRGPRRAASARTTAAARSWRPPPGSRPM